MKMSDVARVAGVSVTTVSHVLNRTRPVSERTRARVDAAIQSVGYVPNHVARSLVRSSSQLIGLAVCDIANHHFYFGELFTSIEGAVADHRYTVLLADTHESAEGQRAVVDALLARRVDGLILAPAAGGEATLELLLQQHIPTVLVDRLDDDRFDRVGTENILSLRVLTRHLADLGHQRIAMLAGSIGISTTDERITGYREGLAAGGLPYVDELVAHGGSEIEESERAVHNLLELADPPTALVVGNNAMALGTMRALRSHGRSVPHDVAVVTFDDFVWADAFHPRLTTIAQDGPTIGRRAVEMLVSRMAEPDMLPRYEQVPTSIMHRESCGCDRPDVPL